MARPRKKERTVRVSVTMPESVYARFERMAEITGSDVNTFVRILASLQLVTYEGIYLKNNGQAPDTYEQAQEWVNEMVPTLFPDKPIIADAWTNRLQAEQEQQQELVT